MPEILRPGADPILGTRSPLGAPPSPVILAGRRAFSAAQILLASSPAAPPQKLTVGWHDSGTNPETGSFGLVALDAGLDALIGQIVQVAHRSRLVFVYVVDAADLPTEFSLARRAFAAVSVLSTEQLTAEVAVCA